MICRSCSSDSLREVRMSRYEATYQKTAMWAIVAISIPLLFAFGIGFAILVPMVAFSFYFKYKHYVCDNCGALYQPYIGGLKLIGYHVNGKTYKENPATMWPGVQERTAIEHCNSPPIPQGYIYCLIVDNNRINFGNTHPSS